ncbi:hypothetical protein MAR_036107 [Mya arenaria]|uniref:Uncharacterized protein n=1 Tax=Mya arenaria TaxID=6604 RepID=A0ABY7ENX3_MYAAR|nr:hypothetical protein MAR_035720 [Mya arenaria]WAR11031.1 hypothetical protein MAR_036107 [Mya arenaria]
MLLFIITMLSRSYLRPIHSFGFQFLFQLLNAGLELLDLALELGHQSLLFFKLLVQGLDLILLPGTRAALSRGFTLT